MNTNNTNIETDMKKLLDKAMTSKQGGHTPWYEQIPDRVKPFIEGLESIMRQGKKPNASSVARILRDEFNFPVSRSRLSVWINEYINEQEPR